ncbi:MAG: magnesium transporter [Bdellovibrionales bacterium]|nr:magnesium transporter [Bdellovibrionales bacterium]
MELNPGELDFGNINGLREQWAEFDSELRKEIFSKLSRPDAEELFLNLSVDDQLELIEKQSLLEKRSWLRLLALDDAADLIQKFSKDQQAEALNVLDSHTRREVMGLLAYEEDNAGGLMNPQYIRLRPDMTIDEATQYLRAQARTPVEIIYYAYVLDSEQRLKGIVSFRDLLMAPREKLIKDIMTSELVTVSEEMDREEVSRVFTQTNFVAIPVVDRNQRMKGIVTYDDNATVVQIEATEDIQKLGGMEALDAPYFKVNFLSMIKKRAGWLTILFIGEMFTATAMGYYEDQIQKAVILALFIPLIISSGGNSGSQASTLIIRALALREIRLRDWWRVLIREIASGLTLGAILGVIGLLRITLWQHWSPIYGEHYLLVAFAVSSSLVGVVLWGTTAGSMLPFLLKRLGFDPASASAPFVATLVDVTGLVIYFTLASLILSNTLL